MHELFFSGRLLGSRGGSTILFIFVCAVLHVLIAVSLFG
jgi:hypothetical protein